MRQDKITKGQLFIVAAVITGPNREHLRAFLQQIERASGKSKKKWTKATRLQRHAYMDQVVQAAALHGSLFYARFHHTTDYLPCLLSTTVAALATASAGQPYRATVLIDGLQKAERHRVGASLRQQRVTVKKIRGMRDESDEFIRLADADGWFCT